MAWEKMSEGSQKVHEEEVSNISESKKTVRLQGKVNSELENELQHSYGCSMDI